jgi:Ca2+-binding RTX toxin-like protein
MLRSILSRIWPRRAGRSLPRVSWRPLELEPLGERVLPSVTASFSHGVLNVFGDASNNTIVVSRNAAGAIKVNNGAVQIQGSTPTVVNTRLIKVFGQGGNDTIALDDSQGALPAAILRGGTGNDNLIGSSNINLLFGEAGNDLLNGRGGSDLLLGGTGNDVLTGGEGADFAFGETGNDKFVWNPGDGSDVNEGGDGVDTVEVNGGNGAEVFTVAANGTRVRFDRVNPAPFSIDIGTSENLVVNANGGDDTFTASNGLAPLISLTVDGGTGNDTITGGDGNDVLIGGDGNDTINGGRGNDVMMGGAGNDTFVWNPGDGSDIVEGQAGTDTMVFNGANIAEKIDMSANGQRVRFTRDVANIVMDLNGVEDIDFTARRGADQIVVHDLSGTGVTQLNLDLAGVPGSGAGDGAADTVTVEGTAGDDAITVAGGATGVSVAGLAAQINITGAEAANDQLTISAQAGDDALAATGLAAGTIQFAADGGNGDDVLSGSPGNDRLSGGAGDDVLIGGGGTDVLDGGPGNNVILP